MKFIRAIAVVLFLAVARAPGESTLSLRAIARNGALITPTNNLAVAPGDTIVAEVKFSGWSTPPFDDPANTGLVQTFQATLLGGDGVISNGADPSCTNRLVLPVGWDAPIVRDNCPCNDPKFPTCHPGYGCVGPGHAPTSMANLSIVCNEIDTDLIGGTCTSPCCFSSFRSDHIFYGFSHLTAVDITSLDIRWSGTIDGFEAQRSRRCNGGSNVGGFCDVAGDCPGGTCDANFQSYAGTLALKVGEHACGTYRFTFSDNVIETFICNAAGNPDCRVPSMIQGLTLTAGTCPNVIGACCDELAVPHPVCTDCVHESACTGAGKRWGGLSSICATMNPPCPPTNQITVLHPPHCTIDARIPHIQGLSAQRRGFTSMIFTFQNPPGYAEDTPDDFEVTQIPALPAPPNPPTIVVTNGPGANDKTLTFNVPIQPNRWTCIRHIASNARRCLGFLPGDANGNGFVLPNDILEIVDTINGVRPGGPLPIHLCDIDRSGVCLPADLIGELDLLKGFGFSRQIGKTLPPCPSTSP